MKRIYIKPLTETVRVSAEPLMALNSKPTGNEQTLDKMETDKDLGIEISGPGEGNSGFEWTKPNITDIWADEDDW